MSDSLALYSSVLDAVRKANPNEDLRRQSVFAWMVTGLVLEQTLHLSYLANVIVSTALAASRVRRISRFLANTHVKVQAYYDGLIRPVLAAWAGQTLYLVIDPTSLAGRMVICRISIVYRGRAVPLVWQVYQRKSVMLAFKHYRDLLEHVLTLLPSGVHVVLLGDRGFRCSQLRTWCRQQPNWHFRIRLKGQQLVTLLGAQPRALADVRLRPGMVRFLHGVYLGKRRDGPFNIALAWAEAPGAEPWYIVTDEPATWQTLTEYGWRMDIDESFRDDKSGGFQLEDTRLLDIESVSRLLLVMAVACLYLVSVGVYVVATEQRQVVDPHAARGLSYFQIGSRWLRRMLHLGQGLVCRDLFRLSPDPDLAPVGLPRARRQPPNWVECPSADDDLDSGVFDC